jgi:hypothetical protein
MITTTVRIFFSLLVILLLVPQTPSENFLLRSFYATGLFSNYGEANFVLVFLSWFSIFGFLIITFFTVF